MFKDNIKHGAKQIDVYSTDEIIKIIKDHSEWYNAMLNDYKNENHLLKLQNENLKTESGKEDYINEELSKLRKENDLLKENIAFTISKNNWKNIRQWQDTHNALNHDNHFNSYEYTFYSNGLITTVECTCTICNILAQQAAKSYKEYNNIMLQKNAKLIFHEG